MANKTIHIVLAQFREEATSNRDLGDRFSLNAQDILTASSSAARPRVSPRPTRSTCNPRAACPAIDNHSMGTVCFNKENNEEAARNSRAVPELALAA